jgi:hypothetical protein
MKRIISYKLFESFGLDNNLRDYISDILAEIEDLGLSVKIDEVRDGSSFSVKISLGPTRKVYYKVDDVYHQLLSLDSYIKSQTGWYLYYLSCTYYSDILGQGKRIFLTNKESDTYSKIEDFRDRVMNDSNKIAHLDLSFIKY